MNSIQFTLNQWEFHRVIQCMNSALPAPPAPLQDSGLEAMMGACCGTARGSRGRWRKPPRISVHGKGREGGSVRRQPSVARGGVSGLEAAGPLALENQPY